MMSLALRATLACQAVLLLAITPVWLGAAAPAPVIVASALAGLLALNVFMFAWGYVMARCYATRHLPPGERTGAIGWRGAVAEVLALFVAYVFLQPFERWWMGADPVGRCVPGRVPVLLVHGYLCNRGMWWWMRRRLRACGYTVATVNLEPPLADVERLAARLAQRIDALLAETGADRVAIVSHSLGGLVSRAFLRRHGARRVACLVTLAAPHHGSRLARFAPGRSGRQMRPGDPWLACLNAATLPGMPVAGVWSAGDELVAPPESARLAGARETILSGIGHMALAFSPKVARCLESELASRSGDGGCAAAARP